GSGHRELDEGGWVRRVVVKMGVRAIVDEPCGLTGSVARGRGDDTGLGEVQQTQQWTGHLGWRQRRCRRGAGASSNDPPRAGCRLSALSTFAISVTADKPAQQHYPAEPPAADAGLREPWANDF